jgi:hypothetical protein
MSRAHLVAALALLATPLLACPGKGQQRAEGPAPRPIRVPKGCEKSQAGDYYHAQNPAFRYRGEDDGGTLLLQVLRAQEDGGVSAEAADGGSLSIHLERTPDGFVGDTRAVGFTATGASCPVSFPTEAVACDEERLTLRAAPTASFDEQCQPPPAGPARPRVEQVLVRGAPDAGTP